MEKNQYFVLQLGRAAKRMQETTGEEAKTIHRLLEIGKLEEDKIEYDVAPIDADLIIIDEMSMVDLYIMNYLMKAIYLGTKLILVGDENQLPSVGPGAILKDIIESCEIPTIKLKKIFRQAAKSKIIVNAHNVNAGVSFTIKNKPENPNEETDFFFINDSIPEVILSKVISLCTGRLQKYGNYNFFDNIQVLTPTKKGILGIKELNKQLQNALNPVSDLKNEKIYGEIIYREGDRIMQVKNNYDITWQKSNGETGIGIFNGEIGKIIKINNTEKHIKIEFDDEKIAWYEFNELEQIELAYSITIHKSQGSEFDVVILIIPKAYQMLLTRNLLYTALTRAKKLLIVIGGKETIDFMVNNTDTKKRNTGLEYKLKNNIMKDF